MSQNSYLIFLKHAEDVNDAFDWVHELDQTSRRLLELISTKHAERNAMTVGEAMELVSVASPATIHRKLWHLHEMGLVEFVFLGGNRRTKYLYPTSKAGKYFIALEQCLLEAVKSTYAS